MTATFSVRWLRDGFPVERVAVNQQDRIYRRGGKGRRLRLALGVEDPRGKVHDRRFGAGPRTAASCEMVAMLPARKPQRRRR